MSILNNNLNNRPVGFFDSGVGGLSVYARFRDALPNENTLYFGDTANLPYGNKSKDELVGFARRILDFYKEKNVKAVVIACNTSSAQAYDIIKGEYDFKIYPIIQTSAKGIGEKYSFNKIGVFATPATIESGVYKRELQKYKSNIEVYEMSCPNWVSIVENSLYEEEASITDVKNQVEKMLEHKPDKIIMGCTHYPYLMNILTKFAQKDMFIDPAEIFVECIKKDFIKNDLLNCSDTRGVEQIFVSSNPNDFIRNAKIFYEINELPQLV